MKKIICFILIIITAYQSPINAQSEGNKIKTALLIVDIQDFYFPGSGHSLVNPEAASLKAKKLLEIFRENKQLVVHVRHKASKGFEINKNVKPLPDEKVITKEEVNSFLHTDLLEYLNNNNITRLVIIGMQTQLCLEAAVRAAHDFGFECIVVQDACATRDVKFGDRTVKAEDVQTCVLSSINDGGYAKVIDLKDFEENVQGYLFQIIE